MPKQRWFMRRRGIPNGVFLCRIWSVSVRYGSGFLNASCTLEPPRIEATHACHALILSIDIPLHLAVTNFEL